MWIAQAFVGVLIRPQLWSTAVRQIFVLAPSRWWTKPPFLPLPDASYLAFRFQTMYGDPKASPDVKDVVTYLAWCKRF